MGNKYAKVIVNTSTRMLDRPFTYRIPNGLVGDAQIGYRALVPFGKGNKYYEGFIIDVVDEIDCEIKDIKEIKEVLVSDINLTKKQLQLCLWLRQTYLSSYYEGIKSIVPSGSTYKSKIYYEYDKKGIKDRYNIDVGDLPDKLDLAQVTHICEDAGVLLNTLKRHKLITQIEEFYTSVKLKKKKIINLNIEEHTIEELLSMISSSAKKQHELIKLLIDNNSIEYSYLRSEFNISSSIIRTLEKKGVIYITEEDKYRNPIVLKEGIQKGELILNQEQEDAFYTVKHSIDSNIHDRFLLHGITGSGKTSVYMKLTKEVIEQGRQVIILVPEISLTTQILSRFVERFGHKVAILHSKLSVGERYDQWIRIKRGELPIVIGARSAVFAPCDNIGMIILDEEHEGTYKSESNPKYHTRNVARYITKQHNGILLLGSATPSVETYHYAKENRYKLLELNKRYNDKELPAVRIVDMRNELNEGNRSIFSTELYNAIERVLGDNRQVILFLNRRGYSNYIACRNCGFVLKCDSCDISLTFHQKNNYAKCHYCGRAEAVPKVCPECSSEHIKGLGIGTEKVEDYIRQLFPKARVARLDQDTTSVKHSMDRIINDFEDGEYDILIGTQMVAKGLDFPNVALVGVLLADTTLNLPDYMANERTFQLLTQVAGRAGRHEVSGEVFIQTYEPENYAIQTASKHDYINFFKKEIDIRKTFEYPPFYNISNITVLGKNEDDVIKSCYNINNLLKELIYKVKGIKEVELMGPNPALITKINNFYRWQILVKYDVKNHSEIKKIINYVCKAKVGELLVKNTSLIFDLKPFKI